MRRKTIQTLVLAGFDSTILDFLIPEPTKQFAPGGARNLSLLLTAGLSVLTLDDDVLCNLHDRNEDGASLALWGHSDPRCVWWFETRADALAACRPNGQNVLAAHERLLGWSLLDLAARTGPALDTTRACRHILRTVATSSSRVRATWLGVVGDGGVYCPHSALFSDDENRERMAHDEEAFLLSLRTREVLRVVSAPTVTDDARFMTYCAGLDNTDLLPPFSPIGTNEDGLFGSMLRLCDPSWVIGQLPAAVVHDSSRPSAYATGPIRAATQVRMTEIVINLLRQWPVSSMPRNASDRMEAMGKYLIDVAHLDPPEFQWHVRTVVVDAKWRAVNRCDELLCGTYNYPKFWRDALAHYREVVLGSIANPRSHEPIEYSHGARRSLEQLQADIMMFGRALVMWPHLWQAARLARTFTQ